MRHEVAPLYAVESIIERWTQRHLRRLDHERRVARAALALFDLTRRLHGLGPEERLLLRLGAFVHDVGRSIDDKRHPIEGAKMLLDDTSLPLNVVDRRRLAYLTRYHRGAVPEVAYDDILRQGDGRRKMRLILALLRAADTLDNRQLTPPRLAFELVSPSKAKGKSGENGQVRIICEPTDDSPKARRTVTRRKKFRLLEESLDVRVQVDVKEPAPR